MNRVWQVALIASLLGSSWLGMQIVHESGHILGAYATGAKVSYVALHPLTISRTDVVNNSHPLITVWMGPIFGVAFPVVAYLFAAFFKAPGVYLLRFFAGFCCVTNGAYIGGGSFEQAADAGVMLAAGSPRWTPLAFGIASTALGLFLWHRQGVRFGLGKTQGEVSRRAAIATTALFFCIVLTEILFNQR